MRGGSLLALCWFAACCATLHAEDWPHWRGPRHDGISRETDWSSNWPSTGPRVAWQAAVGTGFSSVSVADGRAFTMGHQKGQDTVWCFDADTGREIWRYSYPCQLVANMHDGGPGATPTVDGDRVYTLSKEGHLLCFDAATGKGVWSKMLPQLLGVEMPGWGFACSPLVVDNMLIVEAGRTFALDKRTGKELWATDKFQAGYGSPVLFTAGQERFVAVLNSDKLLAIRPRDGSIVASYDWNAPFAATTTTPVVTDRGLFISMAYDHGCVLLGVQPNGFVPVWKNEEMNNHMATCVVWQDHLFGFDGMAQSARRATLVCMRLADGEVKWRQRGLGVGNLVLAGDRLIVLSDAGELVVAPASVEGFEPVAQTQVLDGRCWTVPTLANGRLYCRNSDGHLVCLDLRP